MRTYNLRMSCLLFSILQLVCGLSLVGGSFIGVCYGIKADNLPTPKEVVSLYQLHKIKRMRIYEPDHEVLHALRGSRIQVIVGVKNEEIEPLANSNSSAHDWVQRYVKFYWPDVVFRYILVGNEAIPSNNAKYILPAMQNLYVALVECHLSEFIKVSTAVGTSVIESSSYKPSTGEFSSHSIKFMIPIARYLQSIHAPLMANVYPYDSYISYPKNISLEYALFTSTKVVINDGRFRYQNLFDGIIDTLYAALEKIQVKHVMIIVSETGWPSRGHNYLATLENAWLYNSNVVKHVFSARGTPKRRGKIIQTYLYAMFNENMRSGSITEKNWGWGFFYPNKTKVYEIQFELKKLRN